MTGEAPLQHEEVEELLGAYALDAVEPDEAAGIESHLAVCPRCQAELAGYREVVGLFAYSGQEAPAGLWDRITSSMQESPPPLRLDRIRSEPRRRAPVPSRQRQRAWAALRARPALAVAAAAAVVVAVLAVQVARLSGNGSHPSAAAPATMADVTSALASPGRRKVTLVAPGTSKASLDVVILPDGVGYVYGEKLSPLTADRVYQLWGVVGAERISYGLLGTDPGVEEFRVGTGVKALAVTDEVASGVVRTTRPVTAEGQVSPPL